MSNNHIAVIGLGKTGASIIKWLLSKSISKETLPANHNPAKIFAYDTNLYNIEKLLCAPEYAEYIEESKLELVPLPQSVDECIQELKQHQINIIYSSPGVPNQPAQTNQMLAAARILGMKIYSDIDLFFNSAPKAKYIGITGTNGKSTTTALVGWILQSIVCELKREETEFENDQNKRLTKNSMVFVGGNIGTPILDLPCYNTQDAIYIIELSSYQLDLTNCLQLEVAVCLNVTPDHLDRYGNMDNYAKSKQSIFSMLRNNGLAVIGSECSYLVQKNNSIIPVKNTKIPALQLVGSQEICLISGKQILYSGISVYDCRVWIDGIVQSNPLVGDGINCLVGVHNAENIAAAIAICMYFSIGLEKIIDGCRTFKSLPHRMEYITTYRGYRVINDSKATNVESTKYALDACENIYWIAGGICKDEGVIALQKFFHKITCAYLIGQCENEFAEVLAQFGVRHQVCHEMLVAMIKIKDDISTARKNDGTILLSPACASTDQWSNFEERGKAFCQFFVKED